MSLALATSGNDGTAPPEGAQNTPPCGGRDGIADRDHVPFLEKWGSSLGGPAKTAATNKCLARNNKSQDAGKATKKRPHKASLKPGAERRRSGARPTLRGGADHEKARTRGSDIRDVSSHH